MVIPPDIITHTTGRCVKVSYVAFNFSSNQATKLCFTCSHYRLFSYDPTDISIYKHISKLTCCSIASELGDGWAPALIESELELGFIRENQDGNPNFCDYWIGGHTNTEPRRTLNFSDYNNTGSGNHSLVTPKK